MKRRAKKTQNFPEKLAKAGWLLTGEKGVIQRVKMIFNRTFFFHQIPGDCTNCLQNGSYFPQENSNMLWGQRVQLRATGNN